jgi:hypothetical protein
MPRNQRKLGLLGAALLCLLAIAVKGRQDRPAAGIVAQPEKLSPSSKTRLNDSTTEMEKSLVDPKKNRFNRLSSKRSGLLQSPFLARTLSNLKRSVRDGRL